MKERKKIDSFEEFINEDSMQIMYTMSFTLQDLMKHNLITFNDDITTEDVKGIYNFFEKSYMTGDSLAADNLDTPAVYNCKGNKILYSSGHLPGR